MRTIINISVPEITAKEIRKEVRIGGFSSTSEFFRHLLREQKARNFTASLKRDREQFEHGKGKKLSSLKDLR
ncbi:MAG: ribbon-helix-helix domain-containing protein [bacterium]|nr:ribbon-helix-helix domain-containing protein [bacterium]